MNLPTLLSKAKELGENATSGPWSLFSLNNVREVFTEHSTPRQIVNWMGFDDSNRKPEEHEANAAFIAFARSALPLLVRIVERQGEALKFYSERGGPGGTGAWVLRQPYHFDMAIKDRERILLGETPYWIAGKAARTAIAECEKIAAEITGGREGE